ncbi:MAG TPA: tetratricopeptide repeat protein [Pyrinomonadaceae bacterium]|jgi:tetratricopeptide (TPR) repeat protein
MSLKSIKLESPARRAVLLVAVLVVLAGVYFFAKWCLGSTIAAQSLFKEHAEVAIYLSPSDPQGYYALAVLNEKSFLAEDLPKAVAEYEKATALSPYDFRLWLALGRARERSGDAAGAENALRRAVELAPNYAEVRWTLGNNLLRQGKTEDAFNEIGKAIAGDSKYINQAVATASDIFDGQLPEIKRYLGDSPQVNSALATYLAKRKRFEEALQIWNSLSENDRRTVFRQSSDELYNEMIAAKKYRAAADIQKHLTGATDLSIGKINNGGFEEELKTSNPSVFDWQFAEGLQPQIGPNNAQKHGGNLSLLIIFNSPEGRDFRAISQTIAVEAGKKYEFETFYKSELKTQATLKWEIADASDGKILAATGAISSSADWTSLKTEFVVPENSEGVVIRLARDACKSMICPISGSVWFDDFSIR